MRRNIRGFIDDGRRHIQINPNHDLTLREVFELMDEDVATTVLNSFYAGIETGVRIERNRRVRDGKYTAKR